MLTNRLQRRTASSRGGFTLVELLVVIGIIAILAGVALGPITNGIKKAKQSAGVQEAHAIGLAMYSFANDNNQLYPDTSNPSGNTGSLAAAVARPLLSGGYVTDPSIFWISSDTQGTKYAGTVASAATLIAANNISWDFVGYGGPGLSSISFPWLPIITSTTYQAATALTGLTGTAAITVTPQAGNPFGTAGVATFYENNSAAFVTAGVTGAVTLLTAANNGGAAATNAVLLQGQ
jgi:prepilin-type N-terminal cleavage/methylation domain-containing protein